MNVKQLIKQRPLCSQIGSSLNFRRFEFNPTGKKKFYQLNTQEEDEHYSNSQPNPLADVEKRIEASKQKLKWRKPFAKSETFLTTGLRFFAPERTKFSYLQYITMPLDSESIKNFLIQKSVEYSALTQSYIPDRHRILGNDLAAAHFLVHRGGQVRFTRSKKWVKKNELDEYELPITYDADWLINAIKCDNMELHYEGLENIRRLNELKYFSLRNVKQFDDWCLDRVCGSQFDQLNVLDLSGTNITANGLVAVPKLRSLKALVLDKANRSIEFELTLTLLEDVMPDLRILDSADVHDTDTSNGDKPK